MHDTFKNLIAKLAYLVIIIFPFVFLWFYKINLFQSSIFDVIFILAMILLSLNSLTDSSIEIPGFKITSKNTGASLWADVDLKKKNLAVKLHGSSDDRKVKKVIDCIIEKIKNEK